MNIISISFDKQSNLFGVYVPEFKDWMLLHNYSDRIIPKVKYNNKEFKDVWFRSVNWVVEDIINNGEYEKFTNHVVLEKRSPMYFIKENIDKTGEKHVDFWNEFLYSLLVEECCRYNNYKNKGCALYED